jgi:hypothetical protein
MSIFEIIMLLCFGAAWPLSIYKSYVSRRTNGKSVLFLVIIMAGYVSGIIHKLIYSYDIVIYLYMLNAVMVSIDIILFFRNRKIEKETEF